MIRKIIPMLIFALALCIPAPALAGNTVEECGELLFENINMPGSDELFEGYVMKAFYPQENPEAFSHLGEDFLSEADKVIYEYLKEDITNVSGGRRVSTDFGITGDEIAVCGVKSKWEAQDFGKRYMSDQDVNAAFTAFRAQFNFNKILYALLEDCPYELYWFDKTVGFTISYSRRTWTYSNGNIAAVQYGWNFKFQVEKDYRSLIYDVNAPTVDIRKTAATTNAVSNAMNIISKYRDFEDYEKLEAYKNEILELVSYDHAAIDPGYTRGYGDPWQIIYVFDGDSSTNVVCEGYSKAFQYLMDNSVFINSNIECRSVQGKFYYGSTGGEHMWNVVTLDDRLHYIVDLTNSDTGMIGQRGGLFLAGGTGNPKTGYTVTLPDGRKLIYCYSSSALELWGDGSDCPLTLFAKQYVPHNLASPGFSEKLGIQTVETDEETVLEITRRTDDKIPTLKVFTAVYEEKGNLKGGKVREYDMQGKEKIRVNFSKNGIGKTDKTRIFIWTENLEPVMR